MTTFIKHEVNSSRRQYFIKVNETLEYAIVPICNLFPEPKMDNVAQSNSRRLLEIMEEYKKWERNWRVGAIIHAVMRVVINKIEHSPNWRDRIYFLAEKLREGEWKGRALNHPEHDWAEPKPYGGQ